MSITLNHATNHDNNLEEVKQTEEFVLPPKRNRDVTPNRYSPEIVPRVSGYSVNTNRGRMVDVAKAFSASFHSESIPKIDQEASK